MECLSSRPSWMTPDDASGYEFRFTETPKIVDGKFLYESVWDLRRKDDKPLHWSYLNWTLPIICIPHFCRLVSSGLLDACGSFAASPVKVQSFSCDECRVDLQFQVGDGRCVLRCWTDFGTEIEPPRATLEPRQRRDSHRLRPTPPHRPGPVEAMYNN